MGDLHGDLSQTRCALQMAGVLSLDGYQWTGGDTVIISQLTISIIFFFLKSYKIALAMLPLVV